VKTLLEQLLAAKQITGPAVEVWSGHRREHVLLADTTRSSRANPRRPRAVLPDQLGREQVRDIPAVSSSSDGRSQLERRATTIPTPLADLPLPVPQLAGLAVTNDPAAASPTAEANESWAELTHQRHH
jgi:hypothetical protein